MPRVFAEAKQGFDFAVAHRRGDLVRLSAGFIVRDAEKLRAGGVRIAVIADQNAVGFLRTGHHVVQGDAEVAGDFAGQPEFFVGHAGGSNHRGFAAGKGGQFFRDLLDDAGPGGFLQLAVLAELRLHKAVFAVEITVVQASVVAHPIGIDRIVLPRGLADDFVLASADDRVAAGAAGGADAFSFVQEPDAHLEAEIFARERADRADVDRVERVIAV